MNKIFSFLILFTLFLIQFHEVEHLDIDDHNSDHACIICDVAAGQAGLAPSSDYFVSTMDIEAIDFYASTENILTLRKLLLRSLAPRGPPIA
jgi:hypothetical protein